MLSLKSLLVAGAVAITLLVAPVTSTMASVKAHSATAKTTVAAHHKSHKAVAKKAAKNKVKAKKSHKGIAAKAHKKAASH